MTEHLSNIQLAGYGVRTLDSDDLLAVDRHLAACDFCHERLTRLSSEASDRHEHDERSMEEAFHLDYEEHLAAYVDGTASDIDREIVESHVALCPHCAADLRDLQLFSEQPVRTKTLDADTVRVSPWRRGWGQVGWQWSPQFSAALLVAIFILGATVGVLLWTTRSSQRPVEQAGSSASPEAIKETDKESTSAVPQPTADKIAAQPSPEPQENRDQQEQLVALNDAGGRVTLDQRGELAGLEPLPPDLRLAVQTALTTRQLNVPPHLADLSVAGRLRDGNAEQNTFLPLEPIGIIIESDLPTFRWRALEGASAYSVSIHDSRLRSVENSGRLAGTEWTPSRPLKRGVTYTWQIRALTDGTTVISPKPPAPEARFRVLDQAALTSLESVRRVNGSSHLALGVSYWKHGLIDRAEREFEALVTANPGSPVAAQLLTSLRAQRRR
jgi:anti-sigma factor RsiW